MTDIDMMDYSKSLEMSTRPSTEEQLVAAITQLKTTSEALKSKEIDGLEEGDIADLYEDIDLCLDHIENM